MKFDSEDVIKQNERFYAAKVTKNGEPYFYKKSQAKEFNPQIIRQINGSKLLSNKLKDEKNDWLRVENIVEHGDDWLLEDWAEGSQLAKAADYQNGQNLDSIVQLIDVQVALDKIASHSLSSKPIRVGGRTMLLEAEYKQKEKLEPIIKNLKLDSRLIDDAISYWKHCAQEFKASIQHADLTPWHLCSTGKIVTIIDCEHASDDWPRFYDVANFYSALQTRFDLKPKAEEMLHGFSIRRQIDLINERTFWGIVVLRNLFRIVENQTDTRVVNRCTDFTKQIIST